MNSKINDKEFNMKQSMVETERPAAIMMNGISNYNNNNNQRIMNE